MAKKYFLTINAGSSSLKYELFRSSTLDSIAKGHVDNHGKELSNIIEIIEKILGDLINKKDITSYNDIEAVGHRIVHGGEDFTTPVIITEKILKKLESLHHLAPLHNPINITALFACMKIVPHARQIGVFDTAFHQTMPEKAYLYGVPYEWYTQYGVRRYGFHGMSHQFVYTEARKKYGVQKTKRTITCHLGNGCSLAAILQGKVVDTSMGFTPLEGIPMGTRCGTIDPAIIFHMTRQGCSLESIEEILTKKSGLTGISEGNGDMRDLWTLYKKKDRAAQRTLPWFAYKIALHMGSYAMILGGLDCIVFTGGIGEHAWYVRKMVMHYIHRIFKNVLVTIIPTHEERIIAEAMRKLMIFKKVPTRKKTAIDYN